ncbi:MAG: hypothetical protein MZV70_67600 [Desulfobacterales bacterium]|nr:hypothetical protein [Desulfobacterales bacterium]
MNMTKFTPFPGAPIWADDPGGGDLRRGLAADELPQLRLRSQGHRLPGAARPALQRAREAVLHRPRLAPKIPGPPLGAPPQPLAHGQAPARFHRRPPQLRAGRNLAVRGKPRRNVSTLLFSSTIVI